MKEKYKELLISTPDVVDMKDKKLKNCAVLVLLVFLLYFLGIGCVNAPLTDLEMPLYYEIELGYDDEEITLISKNITNSFISEGLYPYNEYSLHLISFNGEEVYNSTFDFPLEASVHPGPECFDNETLEFDPERCPEHQSYFMYNKSEIILNVPYYPMGKNIMIYDSDGLVLNIDVGEYSDFCGNGRCDPDEDYFLCPSECPSGASDRYCDGAEDGICDPDCSEDEDPDCKVSEGIQDLTPVIISVVVVIIIIVLVVFFLLYKGSRRSPETKANLYKRV